MALNQGFWGGYFKNVFVPESEALVDVLENRILPTFANTEGEAEQKANEEWERLCVLPATDENDDLSDAAEEASEAGVRHYRLMMGLRQGLTNMLATALYHLYEQQVMFFHRKEVLHPTEEDNPDLLSLKVFEQQLKAKHGIDISQFSCWATIDELRLLANTVKHGEGGSSAGLYKCRPDLFVPPDPEGIPIGKAWSFTGVFKPLMGEDIYVSVDHLKSYARAVRRFWDDLYSAMAHA